MGLVSSLIVSTAKTTLNYRHLNRHLFLRAKGNPLWERVSGHTCGLDGTRTRDLRRDRAAF